jgi:hypothetical protein
MSQIKAKIYYEVYTGEVLFITSEMEGCVEPTTKEQDIENYIQLKDKTLDEIDFIELKYGTLVSTFKNVKSYSINVKTKTLDFVYYTQEELSKLNSINETTNNIVDTDTLVSQVETLQDSVIDLKYENLLLKGE